jgi:hypothetical protein
MGALSGGLAFGLGGEAEDSGGTLTATPESIRDRAIDVVEGLTPVSLSRDLFRAYRNEGGADFQAWAEANPAGAFRRFQIRDDGGLTSPSVSNTDIEEHIVTLRIMVAYPQNHRAGREAALDRDDVRNADLRLLVKNLGPVGRANFAPPYPDGNWLMDDSDVDPRVDGNGVDFIVITYRYSFQLVV